MSCQFVFCQASAVAGTLCSLCLKCGEDRNRTYLGSGYAEPTTVLKTARATRHPSLSGLGIFRRRLRFESSERRWSVGGGKQATAFGATSATVTRTEQGWYGYLIFLIVATMASKSGHSPVSSLEWSSLPFARISKAPPLEGISVSDLMRSPSSRILAAKLTALGV